MITGRLRIGLAWLLVLTFLVFASPTAASLWLGSAFVLAGLALRAWAAGTIDKGAGLGTGGPYAHTRNPLYLGSFLIGVGFGVAGGRWIWPLAFAVFFLSVYVPTMRQEATELVERYGDRYREYAGRVPAFAPQLVAYRPAIGGRGPDFSWSRYLRYREWEAVLGVVAVLAVLAVKVRLLG